MLSRKLAKVSARIATRHVNTNQTFLLLKRSVSRQFEPKTSPGTMELKCAVQNYHWGTRGAKSIVGRLAKASSDDFSLEEEKPYAELWMGTHQNGPSRIKKDDIFLKEYINENKHVLGALPDAGQNLEDLPFLFKALSIGKALSIQTHPDKARAERLHREQPDIYKDPNHKPELAIALSPFEAFCGFRPIDEIKTFIENAPEIRAAIGMNRMVNFSLDKDSDDETFLRICFEGLLTCEPEIVSEQLKILIDRLSKLDESARRFYRADLLERLHEDFPGDVGCFGIYFFNCVSLEPGEAIYIAPNEPHAYLSGDCIECMACSDNIVRAGLTPKPKDVPILLEMLTYNCEPASSKRFEPTAEDEFTRVFRPPVPDFAVAKITITASQDSYDLIPRSSASILLVINGKAETSDCTLLVSGSVLFVPAEETVSLKLLELPVTIYQAFSNFS